MLRVSLATTTPPSPPPSPSKSPSPTTSSMASSSSSSASSLAATSAASNLRAASGSNNIGNVVAENKKDVLSGRSAGKSGKSLGPRGPRGGPRNQRGPGGGQQQQLDPTLPRNKFLGGGSKGSSSSRRLQQQRGSGGQDWSPSSMTEADEFEVGSVFNAGSKKQSLNHLLNFQFEPRGTGQYNRGGKRQLQKKNHGSISSRPKYNKEQYLQANCQFVVTSGSDLSTHLADPDTLVAWELIEQVGLKTSGVPSCPICLYPPTAAKIARCGHVFCWSCILHYLALSDDAWRKCPICYDSIYKDDLKSVVSLLHSDLNTGGEIEMHLMRRERDSLFAVPVGKYYSEIEERHPSVSQTINSYSKLVTATSREVARVIIARERAELEEQYRAEKDEPESCFIEEALRYLSEREVEIASSNFYESVDSVPAAPVEAAAEKQQESLVEETLFSPSPASIMEETETDSLGHSRHVSSSSDGASSIELDDCINNVVSAEDLDLSHIKQGPQGRKDTFYFYQSSDGQAIFLHALNVQMLVQEYGAFENCPPVIRGKILEKDSSSMTEELRNKLRYLRHLPVTCNFEVCEMDLGGQVCQDTVAIFSDELEARRVRRARRAREEKRREKRIQVEENKLMGIYPHVDPKLRIESDFHFPQVSSSSSFLASSSSPPLPPSDGMSFAKMLRDGKKTAVASMKRSETSPFLPPPSSNLRRHSDSDAEAEGYVPAPRTASIGDALAMALEKAASLQLQGGGENGGGGRKKGKKNKGTKILLTGGASAATRPEA